MNEDLGEDFVKVVEEARAKANATVVPDNSGEEVDPDDRKNPKSFDYAEYKGLQGSMEDIYGMKYNKERGGYDVNPIKWDVDEESGHCYHEDQLEYLKNDLDNVAQMRQDFSKNHCGGKMDPGHQKQIDALNIFNVGVRKDN